MVNDPVEESTGDGGITDISGEPHRQVCFLKFISFFTLMKAFGKGRKKGWRKGIWTAIILNDPVC